jgi:hypothetical protein
MEVGLCRESFEFVLNSKGESRKISHRFSEEVFRVFNSNFIQ